MRSTFEQPGQFVKFIFHRRTHGDFNNGRKLGRKVLPGGYIVPRMGHRMLSWRKRLKRGCRAYRLALAHGVGNCPEGPESYRKQVSQSSHTR